MKRLIYPRHALQKQELYRNALKEILQEDGNEFSCKVAEPEIDSEVPLPEQDSHLPQIEYESVNMDRCASIHRKGRTLFVLYFLMTLGVVVEGLRSLDSNWQTILVLVPAVALSLLGFLATAYFRKNPALPIAYLIFGVAIVPQILLMFALIGTVLASNASADSIWYFASLEISSKDQVVMFLEFSVGLWFLSYIWGLVRSVRALGETERDTLIPKVQSEVGSSLIGSVRIKALLYFALSAALFGLSLVFFLLLPLSLPILIPLLIGYSRSLEYARRLKAIQYEDLKTIDPRSRYVLSFLPRESWTNGGIP